MPTPQLMHSEASGASLLEVDDLRVDFFGRLGRVQAVRGVTFAITPGETFGLVGESGSGKSVTSQAILGIVDAPGKVAGGDIRWNGHSLLHGQDSKALRRRVLGKEISVVFQDPMASLNPVLQIGTQITEVLRHHLHLSRRAAVERAAELLSLVGISNPRRRMRQYPGDFSGGMRQRVLIAMALACEPKLLIADEPTTALDVTIQAQIMELLAELRSTLDLSVLLITHDLALVAQFCDRMAVMYAGTILEKGPTASIFASPVSPYTEGLLRATPRLDVHLERLVAIPGEAPDLRRDVIGCAFHPRCGLATPQCRDEAPTLLNVGVDHEVACWNRGPAHEENGCADEPR